MPEPPLDPLVADAAPHADVLTPYDEGHLATYLRLLDAEAEGADWTEVVRIVLHIDPSHEPTRARRAWESVNGNLGLTEFNSVGYDSVNHVIVGGAQDVGVVEQVAAGSNSWITLLQDDGGIVQVVNQGTTSTKYVTNYGLKNFQAFTNLSTTGDVRALEVNGTGLFDDDELVGFDPTIPSLAVVAFNAVDPSKLLVGTQFIYEEDPDIFGGDPGDDVSLRNGSPVGLFLGFFGAPPSWNRHAFHLAALAAITIALVHAFFDFNFYIPANPATLATIAGAAVVTSAPSGDVGEILGREHQAMQGRRERS